MQLKLLRLLLTRESLPRQPRGEKLSLELLLWQWQLCSCISPHGQCALERIAPAPTVAAPSTQTEASCSIATHVQLETAAGCAGADVVSWRVEALFQMSFYARAFASCAASQLLGSICISCEWSRRIEMMHMFAECKPFSNYCRNKTKSLLAGIKPISDPVSGFKLSPRIASNLSDVCKLVSI